MLCSKEYSFMDHHAKIDIYRGMIQYLLDSTNYTLKNIADLSDSSLENILTIYCHHTMPSNFKSEVQLLKLYQIVIEIGMDSGNCSLQDNYS